MIVILGYLQVDIEISSIGMETIEFDSCREVSGDDGDTNSISAII